MYKRIQINSSQLFKLVITIILASGVLFLPALPTREAQQDSWLSGLVAMVYGLISAWIILILAYRFPGQTLPEYAQTVFGKVIGKIIGLFYILFFLQLLFILLREICSTVSVSLLPHTPEALVIAISTIAIALTVRSGLEVIARVNTLVLPIALISIFFIYGLEIKDMNLDNLTPFFENGIVPILKGVISPSAWFGELITLAFLLPYLNQRETPNKAVYHGIIVAGLVFTVVVGGTVALFGAGVTGSSVLPTLLAARFVSVVNILERIESGMVSIWLYWNFIKVAIVYYLTSFTLAQWLGLKDYRPVVFPIGIIASLLALTFFRNSIQLADFLGLVWGKYAFAFELVLPLFILGLALLLGRKGGKNNA